MRLQVAALLLLGLATPWRPAQASPDKCTNVCTCKWKSGKRTVECRDRGLANVPDGIDPETQVLDASENRIGALAHNIFIKVRLTNLQRLYLRNCRIDRIDEDALAGLTNLVELDLSHNLLSAVPSASFAYTPFLRDLVLGHNPLRKIPDLAFKNTPHLVKLDLSNAELSLLGAKGFQGLESLESLKLNHNRIATLDYWIFEALNKLTSIELHENPWICDCHLREMKSWLVKQNLPTLIPPVCHLPKHLLNKSFSELTFDDFACQPVMKIESRFAEATIGENASILCTVTAIPPARVKWLWNGKTYTNHSQAINSYQKLLIQEEGSFKKRSTLVLTNAQETDSSIFFCVAENQAGSVEANFTLHVSLRTAGMLTLGSGQIAGISAALVILILLILLTIMVLFMRLRRMPDKDEKAPAPTTTPGSGGSNAATTGTDSLPLDGCGGPGPPQESGAPVLETTSFNEAKGTPGYAHRHAAALLAESRDYLVNRGYEEGLPPGRQLPAVSPVPGVGLYASQAALNPVENPDLIRDTRRGSPILGYADYARVLEVDEGKLLYSECLTGWPSASGQGHEVLGPAPPGAAPSSMQASLPHPGAKQIRVWQKGVPVLPPVSALKRVLGSTRSSPDEGYQEGTGTDV